MAAAGFLSHYLSGPLPYVFRPSLNKTSFFPSFLYVQKQSLTYIYFIFLSFFFLFYIYVGDNFEGRRVKIMKVN